MSFTSNYLVCAGREIHYTEWGAGNAETVFAWHGLARTGRDMDHIAGAPRSALPRDLPDSVGRGLSQWSPQPERNTASLLRATCRIARREPRTGPVPLARHIDGPARSACISRRRVRGRIRRLVLNDIGRSSAMQGGALRA